MGYGCCNAKFPYLGQELCKIRGCKSLVFVSIETKERTIFFWLYINARKCSSQQLPDNQTTNKASQVLMQRRELDQQYFLLIHHFSKVNGCFTLSDNMLDKRIG